MSITKTFLFFMKRNFVPSGDQARSSRSVGEPGNGARSLPATPTTKMEFGPDPLNRPTNAICVPDGDHVIARRKKVGPSPTLAILTRPVPSALMTSISAGAIKLGLNASFDPSGDHTGSVASRGV